MITPNQKFPTSAAYGFAGMYELKREIVSIDNETVKRICEYLDIEPSLLLQETRLAHIVRARYYCFYFLRYFDKLTYMKIGSIFNKDHVTIIHGIKAIKNDYKFNKEVKTTIDYITEKLKQTIKTTIN